MTDQQRIYKNYIEETLSELVDGEDPFVPRSPTLRGNFRVSPQIGPYQITNKQRSREYLKEIANIENYEERKKAGLSEYNYDNIPGINTSRFRRSSNFNLGGENENMGLNGGLNAGGFRSDLLAGTFSIGGVEFDFRNLQEGDSTVNEALLVLITELLLFINDLKGNEKYKKVLDTYVSGVDTLPQSALRKNISLPVIDTSWAYPGPVYKDKRLPYSYRLREEETKYCGRCFNYVGSARVGKCHRWNNAVTPYFVCSNYEDRNTSFHAGDYKGRFKATDENGKLISYRKGDVVKFKSKTYIATKMTSAHKGSPIHRDSGWRLIDEEVLDGGEF